MWRLGGAMGLGKGPHNSPRTRPYQILQPFLVVFRATLAVLRADS